MVARKKPRTTRWHNGVTPLEDLPANELLAHQVVSERGDLNPSVELIMDAEMNDGQRNAALVSFQHSLSQIGDPNRDPRRAISNALAAT